MNSEQYLRTLEEFFQGEVTGEALFRTLAEALEDPERRYQMRVLEQLERETKELLRENIGPLGGDIAERVGARDRHCTGQGPCGHAVGQSDAHLRA